MTKKERRKLKEFTQSDEWTKATKEQKVSFIKYLANSDDYTLKERKQVCKKLISVIN